MPTFFVNVNHFKKVQFCPNTLTAIRIHLNVIIRTRWALLVQCGSIAIIFCMLNDIFLKKMFKMFKLFDESVWMSSSGPVGPCQYILQVDIVVLKIEIEFFMILFWYSNFSKPFDQYAVISSWYYDNPDLLRLALLPVPTFFTIFFTTFILEGLQKVSKGLKSGRRLFHLYFHRINLFSQFSYLYTLPMV